MNLMVSLIWAAKNTKWPNNKLLHDAPKTQAYLGSFGMLAESGPLWSPKHLARAKDEVRNSTFWEPLRHPMKLNANWHCWWFRNPAITTWDVKKNVVNNGINYYYYCSWWSPDFWTINSISFNVAPWGCFSSRKITFQRFQSSRLSWEPKGPDQGQGQDHPPPRNSAGLIKGLWSPSVSLNKAGY